MARDTLDTVRVDCPVTEVTLLVVTAGRVCCCFEPFILMIVAPERTGFVLMAGLLIPDEETAVTAVATGFIRPNVITCPPLFPGDVFFNRLPELLISDIRADTPSAGLSKAGGLEVGSGGGETGDKPFGLEAIAGGISGGGGGGGGHCCG